jgi:hypothetical protein
LHGLGAVLGHLGAPDCIDAEVFVENHEEAVEPAFAEAFVIEAGELLFCCFGLGCVSLNMGFGESYSHLHCHL